MTMTQANTPTAFQEFVSPLLSKAASGSSPIVAQTLKNLFVKDWELNVFDILSLKKNYNFINGLQ